MRINQNAVNQIQHTSHEPIGPFKLIIVLP